MKVTEIFRSVQGEGIYTGKPAVFVRLAGCNLKCSWCDTRYSSWELTEFEEVQIDDLLSKIIEFDVGLVIFTGGEPCLQSKELITLCEKLKIYKVKIHIETNGTIFDNKLIKMIDFWSINPKLSSSTNQCGLVPFKIKIIKKIINKLPIDKYQLKFVISEDNMNQDIIEVEQIIKKSKMKHNANIIFQPEGTSTDIVHYSSKCANLAEILVINQMHYIMKQFSNARVLSQMHKFFWWNKRKI
ncbi:MAG: 7-carboxy-7-deazaguanine synthase QueE [Armatimonadetes bacterium]|nr:7-carboxy-7-deazaguanine synthase QueE [Armatimonadota bacterium]